MRIWIFEVGSNGFPPFSDLIPSFVKYRDVRIEGGDYADEYALMWLGMRLSVYVNRRTYDQMIAERSKR